MKRVKSQLSLGLVCIILGLMLSFQLKSTFGAISNTKERQLRDISKTLDDLKKEKDNLNIKLQETQKKVDDYEKAAASQSGTAKMLKDEIDKLRFLSGLVDVQGQGIVITIKCVTDLTTRETFPIVSSDLVEFINDLNSAGAEAISINDERYVGRTQILDIGNNIKINDVKIDPTQVVTIKAIGAPDILNGVFKLPGSIVQVLQDSGMEVKISEVGNIKILKYNKTLSYKYMKKVGR